jgi:WD40 repeat protein
VLDQVRTFIASDAGPRALVVVGDPGAGKTTLLARIARDTGAAHFFFGKSDWLDAGRGGGLSEPIRCAETLGTQLVRSYGPDIVDWSRFGLAIRIRAEQVFGRLTGAELGVYTASSRPAEHPAVRVDIEAGSVGAGAVVTGLTIHELRIDPMVAAHELFLGPLRHAAVRTQGKVVLVLDAMDEWDRVASPVDLLELLQLSDLPANIRVVASARPSYLPRLGAGCTCLDISSAGAQAHADADIGALIDTALRRRGLAPDPEVRQRMVARSAGNLLFASYLVAGITQAPGAAQVASLPAGLEAYYREELQQLVDQLSREGMRASIGPLLAVLCAAQEPLDAALAARAAQLGVDATTDVLHRIVAFVRPREIAGATRYAPFHQSFRDYVLSGRAGLGIAAHSAHLRLATTLAPADPGPAAWQGSGDYAIRHTLSHLAQAGAEAAPLAQRLVDNPGYLVARVERLGPEAIDSDLRHARQAGYTPAHLQQLVVELAMRAPDQRAAGVSVAQGLAAVALAVGARALAQGFATLAPESTYAVPRWSAGLERASLAAGWFRSEGPLHSAALTAGTLLTLALEDGGIEVWNLGERLRIATLAPVGDRPDARAEAGGQAVWVATTSAPGSLLSRHCLADGAVLAEVRFHQEISALAMSADGRHLAVGTWAGRVCLVDAADGRTLARREAGSRIAGLAFDGDCLAALTVDRKVVAWSLPALAMEGLAVLPRPHELCRYIDRTEGLAFDARRMLATVGGVDGTVTAVPLDDDGGPRSLASLAGWADHLAFLDGGALVAGDSSGRLYFIGPELQRPAIAVAAHTSAVILATPFGDGSHVASVAAGGEVGLWQIPSHSVGGESGHTAAVRDVAYSLSGTRLRSLAADGSVFEWNAGGGVRQRAWLDPAECNGARLCADFDTVVLGDDSLSCIRLSDAPASLLAAEPWPIEDKCNSIFVSRVRPVSVSADGCHAAVGTSGGLEVWSLDPVRLRLRFPGHRIDRQGALSGDGQLLVSTDEEGGLWLRTLDEETPARRIPHGDALLCPPFWSAGGLVLLTHAGRAVACIDAVSLATVSAWTMAADTPSFAAVSPDGATIAVFGIGGYVEWRRQSDGVRLGGLVLRPAASAAAFSPDGASLAIGDLGGGIQVYRLQAQGVNSHDP